MCEDGIHTGGRIREAFFHTAGMFPVCKGKSIIIFSVHGRILSMDGVRCIP